MSHPDKSPSFTHFDAKGQAQMVDVADKPETRRIAIAKGCIRMSQATLQRIIDGQMKKGDVLAVARLAAIMGTKHTATLIPLCHPLALTHVHADFRVNLSPPCIYCTVQTETWGRTGVEMEALMGVQIGLLTIYDMCKAVERGMEIGEIHLVEKHGGQSGDWVAGTR